MLGLHLLLSHEPEGMQPACCQGTERQDRLSRLRYAGACIEFLPGRRLPRRLDFSCVCLRMFPALVDDCLDAQPSRLVLSVALCPDRSSCVSCIGALALHLGCAYPGCLLSIAWPSCSVPQHVSLAGVPRCPSTMGSAVSWQPLPAGSCHRCHSGPRSAGTKRCSMPGSKPVSSSRETGRQRLLGNDHAPQNTVTQH